jgi:ubiquinone/menaquinone biosynthesis C-methylase UbiE
MLQRQKDNVRVYFDRVSGEYERAYDTAIVDSLKTYIFLRRQEKVINILEKCGGRVLDIGCGPGVFTDKLIDKGYEKIWGVDNSEAMIESAKKRMVLTENSGKINFVVGDIEKLNFADNYFDCAV